MNKPFNPKPYLVYGLLGAIVYCIPVAVFLSDPGFRNAWLLYLGNLLFLFAIVAFLFRFNKKRSENASSLVMLAAGHIATAAGIIISCILAFLLLVILVHGADDVLSDKTRGINFMVFATAIIGNLSTGSFVSIVFPFALKADQTREQVPRREQGEL